MFINKASELIEESSSFETQSLFEPSFPLRPTLKRPVTGRNEIAMLRSAWQRLINDDWDLAVAGQVRQLMQRCV